MKKTTHLLILFTALSFPIFAQNFDLSQFDQVIEMVSQGNQKSSAKVFDQALTGLNDEVGDSNTAFAPKIKNQISIATALLPSLLKENTDLGTLKKVVLSLKTLMAAHRLQKMVKDNNLVGQGANITKNLNLLKLGLDAHTTSADAVQLAKVNKLLSKVNTKIPKLTESESAANVASKLIQKKLGSSLNIISEMI